VQYVEGRAVKFDYAEVTGTYEAYVKEWWATHDAP